MAFYDEAKKHNDYIVEMRRYFHENPELSGKEDKTIERLAQELDSMGIEYVIVPNGGIIATMKGGKPGTKTVMLRADVDALPVIETEDNLKGKRVCKSKVDGVMHACGHDAHMAMLLGSAKILKAHQDEIPGTIYLVLERGEEGTGNIAYLLKYMEEQNIVPDSAWGIHMLATLESGKMAIIDGDTMAAAMGFDITLEGSGGHGSRPDQAISPIDCFCAIYQRMEAIRLTNVTPFKTLTYSVGMLNAGVVGNVIPQTLRFSGTARSFDRAETGLPFYKEFKHAIEKIAEAYHCKVTYNRYALPGYAVINDHELALAARKWVGDAIGTEKIVEGEPWMASESYSQYQVLFTGVFAFLGMKNDETGIGAAHHNPAFDVDEEVLADGAAASAAYAMGFLSSDIETKSRQLKGGYKELLKGIESNDLLKQFYGE